MSLEREKPPQGRRSWQMPTTLWEGGSVRSQTKDIAYRAQTEFWQLVNAFEVEYYILGSEEQRVDYIARMVRAYPKYREAFIDLTAIKTILVEKQVTSMAEVPTSELAQLLTLKRENIYMKLNAEDNSDIPS